MNGRVVRDFQLEPTTREVDEGRSADGELGSDRSMRSLDTVSRVHVHQEHYVLIK